LPSRLALPASMPRSTTRIFDYFENPQLAVLLGITAGLRDRSIALGDVIVPKATLHVESGKVTPKGKEPAGLSIRTSSNLHGAIASWPGIAKWATKWKKKSPNGTLPRLHSDCILACTASVIAYGQYAQGYRMLNRKIAGIEMEAVGIGSAAENKQCPFLIVKAFSDWADKKKTDVWHRYCMQVSADLVVSMLEDETL
jgi:nucleoside phosphorylase